MTLLLPPFGLNWTLGNYTSANRTTGKLYAGDFAVLAGSSQAIAQVGSAFYGPYGTRRIRVEAKVTVDRYRVTAPAFLGYASAEALLNLRVMDGSQIVAHDRRSLARAIAVLFWVSELKGGPFTVSMATEFYGGGNRQYSAHVDVETWVGGGGFVGPDASCSATVHQLDVRVL